MSPLLAMQREPLVTLNDDEIVLNSVQSDYSVCFAFTIAAFFLSASLLIHSINHDDFYFPTQLLTQPWFWMSITCSTVVDLRFREKVYTISSLV